MKQADVILMGFPLMMSMPDDVRKNDLHTYENVTNFSALRIKPSSGADPELFSRGGEGPTLSNCGSAHI